VSAFSFRLDPLLSLRKHEERMKQQALAQVVTARTARLRRLALVQREFEDTRRGLQAIGQATLPVQQIRNHYLYLAALRRRMQHLTSEIKRLDDVVAGRREELIEAARRRSVMEQLRERYRVRYLEAQRRTETKVLDEVGTNQTFKNATVQDRTTP